MIQRNSLVLITLAALVGGALAGYWASSQPERYSATTVVAVAPAESIVDDADVIDVVGGLDRGTTVETLAGLAASASVTQTAAAEIGIDIAEYDDYDVDALRAVGSNLVDITASGPDPQVVADLAAATAAGTAAQFNTLYRVYRVDIVTAAGVPTASDRPSALLVVAAGAALGGVAAAVVIAGGESRRRGRHLRSVRRDDESEPLAS
jgi:capsular polysaccharide biosynthesis protein